VLPPIFEKKKKAGNQRVEEAELIFRFRKRSQALLLAAITAFKKTSTSSTYFFIPFFHHCLPLPDAPNKPLQQLISDQRQRQLDSTPCDRKNSAVCITSKQLS